MRRSPTPRPASPPGSASTISSASIRALVTARRGKFTRRAYGYVDDRLRRPAALPRASRASSEGGEMPAFAHIPTGAAANKRFNIDELKSRLIEPAVPLTALQAQIETNTATS